MKKNFLFLITAMLLVAVSILPVHTAAANQFSDVSPKNDYYDIIKEMAAKEVITGYPDGTFKPNELMTRKHAAALISRAFPTLPSHHKGISLTDVKKDNPYYKDIRRVLEADIIQHAKNFDFRPNDIMTRGEMARALTLAYKLSSDQANSPFVDVSPQLTSYVNALYTNGITTGFEDKTFREDKGLTRAHFAVFMYRAEQAVHKKKAMTPYEASKFYPMKASDIRFPEKYKNASEATNASKKAANAHVAKSKNSTTTSFSLHVEKDYHAFIDSAQIQLDKSAQQIDEILYKVYSTGIAESIPAKDNQLWILWFDYNEKKLMRVLVSDT